jgi:hypothetical protein
MFLVPLLLGPTGAPQGKRADIFFRALLLLAAQENKVPLSNVEVSVCYTPLQLSVACGSAGVSI